MHLYLPRYPLLVSILLTLLCIGLLSHGYKSSVSPPSLPSIQSLDIEFTSDGRPVINGLFQRFSWNIHTTTAGCGAKKGTCQPGSSGNPACVPGYEAHTQCPQTGCYTASQCGAPRHNTDCCCDGCYQNVYPCTGCQEVGRGC
jgi:hypothetical protein